MKTIIQVLEKNLTPAQLEVITRVANINDADLMPLDKIDYRVVVIPDVGEVSDGLCRNSLAIQKSVVAEIKSGFENLAQEAADEAATKLGIEMQQNRYAVWINTDALSGIQAWHLNDVCAKLGLRCEFTQAGANEAAYTIQLVQTGGLVDAINDAIEKNLKVDSTSK